MIYLLAPGEGLLSAFHYGHNRFLNLRLVNASYPHVRVATRERTCAHLLGIAQDREVGVLRRENKLDVSFQHPDELDHVLEDGLVVQIVFRLIDEDHVIVPLTQNEQNERRSPLPQRVVPQFLALVLNSEKTRNLPSQKGGPGLAEVLAENFPGIAHCRANSVQGPIHADKVWVLARHTFQCSFT